MGDTPRSFRKVSEKWEGEEKPRLSAISFILRSVVTSSAQALRMRILVKKAIEIKRVVAEHAAKAIGGDAFAGVRLQILLEPLYDGRHRLFSGFGLAHKLQ